MPSDPRVWHPRRQLILLVVVFVTGSIAFGDRRWYGDLTTFFVSLVFCACPWYTLGLLPLCVVFEPVLHVINLGLVIAFLVTAPVQWRLMTELSQEEDAFQLKAELDVHDGELSNEYNQYVQGTQQTMRRPLYRFCYLIQLFLNPVRPSNRSKYHFLPVSNALFQLSLCMFAWYWVLKRWRHEEVYANLGNLFTIAVNLAMSSSLSILRKSTEMGATFSEVHDETTEFDPEAQNAAGA